LANLQFGVNLWPHQWRDAARIEELGYDSVWTSEHVFFYFPTFDALTTLAAVAALTSRIRLGTAVLLLPLRPAALAAKEITSVDVISGRRPPPSAAAPPPPPSAARARRPAALDRRPLRGRDSPRRPPWRRLPALPVLPGALPRQPGRGQADRRSGRPRPGRHRPRPLPVHLPRRQLRGGEAHRRGGPLAPLPPAVREHRRP